MPSGDKTATKAERNESILRRWKEIDPTYGGDLIRQDVLNQLAREFQMSAKNVSYLIYGHLLREFHQNK